MPEAELNLALIQFAPIWGKPGQNTKLLDSLLESVSVKADLIILPEAFSTGFVVAPEDFLLAEDLSYPENSLDWLRKKAAQYGCPVCGSIIHRNNSQKRQNTFFWANPNGTIYAVDKRHLFALGGEKQTPEGTASSFEQGNKRIIIQYKGFTISPFICYDLRFPVWCRNPNDVPIDILLFVANWPEKRIDVWNTLLKARAIENQSFVVGVNRAGTEPNGIEYSGNSGVYSPIGKNHFISEEKEGIYFVLIQKSELTETREKFPFQKDADCFTVSNQEIEYLTV